MTFDADESSVQNSRPRELYQLNIGEKTYRLTSGIRSILFNGFIWQAFQISRDAAQISDEASSPKQMKISLPMDHDACQRYLAYATPPKMCTAIVTRLQLNSTEAMAWWQGDIVSLNFDKHVASFLVTSTAARVLGRALPGITVGRGCPHALYDDNCKVDRALFEINATVLQVDGRKIRVDLGAGHAYPWSVFGDTYYTMTNERMDVTDQTDLGPPSTVVWLTMQAPIVGLKTGDMVTISPGCDHTITTCLNKFNNVVNFGGFPDLPAANPFVYTVNGVIAFTGIT